VVEVVVIVLLQILQVVMEVQEEAVVVQEPYQLLLLVEQELQVKEITAVQTVGFMFPPIRVVEVVGPEQLEVMLVLAQAV
jgi:hypothetical protein